MKVFAWPVLTAVLLGPLQCQADPRGPACAPAATAAMAVVDAVRDAFAAMRDEDRNAWARTTTPDFRAFDAGADFNREQLFGVIAQAHSAGKTYSWSITEPEPHVQCDWAWVTYVNRGSIRDAHGETTRVEWLESAVLRYEGGRWRLVFLHSSRVKEQT